MEMWSLGGDFQPNHQVEGYSSLVWTERYREAGDFELKTSLIDDTLYKLKIGDMCMVRGSNDCKIIESHVIESDPDGEKTLTVTGRSWETFLENRVAHEDRYPMFDIRSTRTPSYNYGYRTTGASAGEFAFEVIKYKTKLAGTAEEVPNLNVTLSPNATIASGGKPRRYMQVPFGTVYERVIDILAIDDLGWRTILPAVGGTVLTLNIYDGLDVSLNVVLSTSSGHFTKGTYAWTDREYKNAAVAVSEWDSLRYTTGSPDGMDRRFGYVDASDIKRDADKVPTGANPDEKELQSRVASYLKKHKKTAIFNGQVSPDIPFKYGIGTGFDYFLGDTVMVLADYGLRQKMMVTEYIRTEDEQGDRAFPTLELP